MKNKKNQIILKKTIKYAHYLLRSQFINAYKKHLTRHDVKRATGSRAVYSYIFSDKTLKEYTRGIDRFMEYCQQNDIYRLSDVTDDVMGNYVMYAQKKGESAWSFKNSITAVNHVLVGAKIRTDDETFKITKWNKEHGYIGMNAIKHKSRQEIHNNRHYTAKEWVDKNYKLYQQNQDMIDTIRAFGLRKSEVNYTGKQHTTGGNQSFAKPAIINKSFFKYTNANGNTNYYVFVIDGKGGRPRFAQCRQDMVAEMKGLYDFQRLNVMPQNMIDIKKFKNQFIKKNEVYYRKQEYIYHIANGNLRYHIFRQEYAQKRYDEVSQEPYMAQNNDSLHTINGKYCLHESQLNKISQDLGHNRWDVLGNYLL